MASCGADRVVALWDVALLAEQGAQGGAGAGLGAGAGAGPAIALHGMTAAVNDCAFTCEGSQVGGRPCGRVSDAIRFSTGGLAGMLLPGLSP